MTSTVFLRIPQTGSFHSTFLTVLEAATGLGTVVLPWLVDVWLLAVSTWYVCVPIASKESMTSKSLLI